MNKPGPERLLDYCTRHGYKQYQLAELLDLHEAHLSQLLTGKRRPGLPIAVRIEERTGIPAESWLLTRVGTAEPMDDEIGEAAEISKGKAHGKLG